MLKLLLGAIQNTSTKIVDFFGTIKQPNPLDISTLGYLIPYGLPKTNKNLIIIGRQAYICGYNPDAKISDFVVFSLTPEHSIGGFPRSNAFVPDYSLPLAQRAAMEDYLDSGYDKGHQISDQSCAWSADTERQSFYLSNMTPQNKALNEHRWEMLEVHERAWCHQLNRTLSIMTGPIYNEQSKTIGKNKVVVPDGYFKIITDTITNESLAFMYENITEGEDDPEKSQVTINEIEVKTGLTFGLLKKDNKPLLWPVDISAYNAAKK